MDYRLYFVNRNLCDDTTSVVCSEAAIDKVIDQMERQGFNIYRKVRIEEEEI